MILTIYKAMMNMIRRGIVFPSILLGAGILLAGCPAFVNQSPIAIIGADPISGEAPLDVQFSGSSSFDPDGTIILFEWNFDDGSVVESGQSPSHEFGTGGTFNVLLTVTDNFGKKDTGTLQINVTDSKIYLSSDRTGDQEIFVMDTDGGNQSQVSSNVNTEIWPALVPNTRDKLSFSSDRVNPGAFFDIFSSNPDGSLPANLTTQTASNSIEPSWSPDGGFIAWSDDRTSAGVFELFVATSSGTLLTGGDPLISESPNSALAPAWRPIKLAETATTETHEIAYVRFDTGTTDTDIILVHFVIDKSTSPPSITGVTPANILIDAATDDGAYGGPTFAIAGLPGGSTPSWKSDGTRIAFTREVGPGNFDIFTMAADGSDIKNINAECFSGNAAQAGSNEFDPYWVENGDIAFVSDRTGTDQLFIVDCSGSGVVTQLTTLGTENVHPAEVKPKE